MLGIIIGVGAVITMIALGSERRSPCRMDPGARPHPAHRVSGQSFMRGVASAARALTMNDDTALANNARYATT